MFQPENLQLLSQWQDFKATIVLESKAANGENKHGQPQLKKTQKSLEKLGELSDSLPHLTTVSFRIRLCVAEILNGNSEKWLPFVGKTRVKKRI